MMFFIEDTSLIKKEDSTFVQNDNISASLTKEDKKNIQKIIKFLNKAPRFKADEVLYDLEYILNNELVSFFVICMLFVEGDKKYIAEHVGVSIKAIEWYEKYFFNRSNFRGKMGKMLLYKKLLFDNDLNKQKLGVILKSAYLFGVEYINWKFGLQLESSNLDSMMSNTLKDMYFKYIERSFLLKDDELHEHIKLGKDIIASAINMQKNIASSGGSALDKIKDYLIQLDEYSKHASWEVEMEVLEFKENKETDDK